MLGGADNPNGELPSYITGADNINDFLVRTGLRSGVSELHLPCFTAVRAEIALMSGSAFAVTHHPVSS
ncbi:InsB [Shigella sonnei]|nr:InsB [Shigella sonnei]CTB40367.1 InsB [Shigella sonnei]